MPLFPHGVKIKINEWKFQNWEKPLIFIYTYAREDYLLNDRLNLLPG